MKKILLFCLVWVFVQIVSAKVVVTGEKMGAIKPMNGVNNGPVKQMSSQCRDNFDWFRNARFPFMRTHDTSFSEAYGLNHVIDITSVFPDFSKNVNKPESYDFALTDAMLKVWQESGSEVYFRLGQKIEHYSKKYGIMPPKDNKKWAEICEHIIRHYTQGWANGYKWNIRYWEIWNEADLDEKQWNTHPRTWGGTEQQFFELYKTAALHLKKCFPELKIGGPALAGHEEWADRFLGYMQQNKVPMDFFSWHIYTNDPMKMAIRSQHVEALLKKHGYGEVESILNEWNYIRNWTTDFPYSVKVMHNEKGAAFNAAVMSVCQDEDVDILMYYDARPETPFNGLFDFDSYLPTRAYYPFYAWSKMRLDYGTQVRVKKDETEKNLYVTAAVSPHGKVALFLSRYFDNDNLQTPQAVKVSLPSGLTKAVMHLTDSYYLYTEIPLEIKNGEVELQLQPNAFVFLEAE